LFIGPCVTQFVNVDWSEFVYRAVCYTVCECGLLGCSEGH